MPASMKPIVYLAALVALAGVGVGAAAGRQFRQSHGALTVLGILTCSLGGADASPAGQTRDVLCQFRFGSDGAHETYTGTIRSVGQTQALYAKGTIILAVKGAAFTDIVPGLLQQAYAAEAVGASAAALLVGETNSAIVLQPWLEEVGRVTAGKTRPDVAIISVELKLEASPA